MANKKTLTLLFLAATTSIGFYITPTFASTPETPEGAADEKALNDDRLVPVQEEKQKHDSFTDPRDGYTYRTVELADQVWMAENLRYASQGSVYYDLDRKNEQIYGRLYTREQALLECPTGWHLPSLEEWIDLVNIYGENYDHDGQLLITKKKKKLSKEEKKKLSKEEKKNRKKLAKEEKKKAKSLFYDTWQSFQVGGTTGFDVLKGGECGYRIVGWSTLGMDKKWSCDQLEGWATFWSTGTKLRNPVVLKDNEADIMRFFKGRKGKGIFAPSSQSKELFFSVRCVMDKPVPLDVEK